MHATAVMSGSDRRIEEKEKKGGKPENSKKIFASRFIFIHVHQSLLSFLGALLPLWTIGRLAL